MNSVHIFLRTYQLNICNSNQLHGRYSNRSQIAANEISSMNQRVNGIQKLIGRHYSGCGCEFSCVLIESIVQSTAVANSVIRLRGSESA